VLVVAVVGLGAYLVTSQVRRETAVLLELARRLETQERSSERILAKLSRLPTACADSRVAAEQVTALVAPVANAPVPATATNVEPSGEDDEAAEAAVRADDVLRAAVERGRWVGADERALVEAMAKMSPTDRADVLVRRSLAINGGKLRLDPAALAYQDR